MRAICNILKREETTKTLHDISYIYCTCVYMYFFFVYLNRTLIEGDAKAGLSIFWADDVCEIDTIEI